MTRVNKVVFVHVKSRLHHLPTVLVSVVDLELVDGLGRSLYVFGPLNPY